MRYTDYDKSTIAPYPSHDIDPAKKGAEWCMSYARAAWIDFTFGVPKGVFANNQGDYEKYRMYALGKQPNSQYKTWLGIDEQAKNTWMSIDWSIRPIVSGYRDRAIARLMKDNYGIVATPVDAIAKSEMQQYYAQMKTKLMIRQLAMQQGDAELAQHPLIAPQSGEPMDVEELEMRLMMGEQFNRSKDAELAIELGFFENKYDYVRYGWYQDLFDCGVAGYKEWLGTDNKPHFRRVNPENIVVSYCRQSDFSDAVHIGEITDVALVDLATYTDEAGNPIFTEKELQEFAGSVAGKWGNPGVMQRNFVGLKGFDKFKCKVLDIEFHSYDDYSYRNVTDTNGNVDFRRADYGRGKVSDKYIRKRYKCVYKAKWVIGTEKVYDFGLAADQKRSNIAEKKGETKLSYCLGAFNFYEMKAQGIMERLIPYLDKYQLTHYKIQNFMNRAVPSGWWIDLDALENVALSKGGAPMQPKELLQMFFETGVLVGRSKDVNGEPMGVNWKPVIPIENTAASELAMFYQDLAMCLQEIEKMTGFNEITTGNPNPKTLVPGYELANQSTNDALWPLANTETRLTECLAYDVLKRMQQGVKKGGIEGYANSLNINTLRYIQVSPDISLREYGIMLEKKTTEQEKMWLLQQMQPDIQNGLLDTSDAVTLVNTHNAKQAQMIWAYKIKRNRELMQQREMEKIQLNNQGAKEAAEVAQQTAMQQEQMKMQFELQKKQMELQAELQKVQMTIESQERIALANNMTKLEVAGTEHDGRVGAASMQGQAKVQAEILSGEAMKEKQRIANEKTAATKKS
jgi:hypothetical protein